MPTIESIQNSIRTAQDWESKNQPVWVARCRSSALLGYLSLAVSEYSDPVVGLQWLSEQSVPELLEGQHQTLKILVAEVDVHRLPSSSMSGPYQILVFSHLAWCLGMFEFGEDFAKITSRPDIVKLSTKFWTEYSSARISYISRRPYIAPKMSLRGQEVYWYCYLRLIEASSNGEDLARQLLETEKSFTSRNRDTTIRDDSYQIEGSGKYPVQWDFRRVALTEYSRHKLTSAL